MHQRYWEPKLEKMPQNNLKKLQLKRLKSTVSKAYNNSIVYRRKFKNAGVKPDSIKKLDHLSKIPFTTKEDFRRNYPYGLLTVSLTDSIRTHASSGTTGNPTVVAYTKGDIDNWSNCIARCLTMVGITSQSIFQIILGYGLFTGGLGFHYGAERIGAMVVPSSTGNTFRQIKLMKDLAVTAFTTIPSYALYLSDTMNEMGVDPKEDLQLKTASCGAESWTEKTREKLESLYGCPFYNSYGLSELYGPGVAFECPYKEGLHVWADHFILEIVDTKTNEAISEGEEGEIILTSISKEACPVFRYRTRDLGKLISKDTCSCGRTHPRISWISGRSDGMLKIRGVNIFPGQIEYAIMSDRNIGTNYQIQVSKKGQLNELTVLVEANKKEKSGIYKETALKLKSDIEKILGIRINVKVVAPNTLPRVEGKAKRIFELIEKN